MKSRLSEDGAKLVTTYELHPTDVDRTLTLTPWTLSQLIAYSGPENSDVFYIPGHLDTVGSFIRYEEFYLLPALYSKVKLNSTVEVSAEVGHVGTTSWVCMGHVRLAGSEDILCSYNIQLVNVDMATRQPTALPQHLQRKGKGSRPRFSLPMSPNTPKCSHKFRVEESNVDANDHTTQSAFIRFCSDAAALATKTGCYPSLRGDLMKYPVKKIALLFQKEALLGDTLEVQSWEIPSKPLSLVFQVKRGKDDIVRCLFELYGQERAKL